MILPTPYKATFDLCLFKSHTQTPPMASFVGSTNWMSVLADDGCLERRCKETLTKLHPGEG